MGKRYFIVKHPHGWFRGMFQERDVITTIDSCIWKGQGHVLIAEVSNNELIKAEREREFLLWTIRRWVTRWQVMAMA